MRSNNHAYVNGEFVPEAQATVSIYDSGFLFGDGVFETMPVYGGKIFRFERHVQRLFRGLDRLKIEIPFSAAGLEGIFHKLCERRVTEGIARVYVTRGPGAVVLSTKSVTQPTVVAIAWPQLAHRPQELRAIVSSMRVNNESSLTQIKSANRLPYVLAKQEATAAGVEEAVLLNQTGHVAEFSAYNLFAVINDRLFTPPVSDGALPGVTREVVLQLAEKLEIPANEWSLKAADLVNASEIFATNSTRGIVPILGLNKTVAQGRKITSRLQEAYQTLVRVELGL
jgi:branched-subunit amino acid aminotransferase/4-amino-4-deoxychorismate lyase